MVDRKDKIINPSNRPFAVFDIDGTLIRWQLYHAIVTELAKQGHLSDEAYARIRDSRSQWKARSHSESFKEYEGTLISVYHEALTNLATEAFMSAVDVVFEEYKDQVYAYTRDLVRSLKQSGYMLFTISGSQNEIIQKLAAYYGFDEAIGNTYAQKAGKFTGEHGHVVENKAELLNQLVKKHGLSFTGSIAVGDSGSDIAMLELVENPIAFNPDQTLLATAKKQGWKIVVERKNVVYELEKRDGRYLLV